MSGGSYQTHSSLDAYERLTAEMGLQRVVNCKRSAEEFCEEVMQNLQQHRYTTYEYRHGAPRNIAQNNLTFTLYKPIGETLFDGDLEYARAVCKLTIGVPIMRRDSPNFREQYDRILKPLSYEEKVRAIMVFELPVTRLMSKKQISEYIDKVCSDYAPQGVRFTIAA